MYGHAANLLGKVHVPGIIQQAGWVALVLIGVIAAIRLSARWLATVDTALDRIAAILLVVTLVLIVPFQVSAASHGATAVVEPKPDTTTAEKRDVYWLIFDRYGSDRSYELLYGIHNTMSAWLREQGFTVLDKSHANYVRTGVSIPTTMSMTHLKDIPGMPGPGQHRPAPGPGPDAVLAGGPPVQGARLPLLPHRLVVDAQRPRRRGRRQSQRRTGRRDFVSALIDESAVPAAIKRLKLEHVTDDERDRHYKHNVYELDALAEHASTSPVPSSSSGTSCSPTRPPSSTATAAS